jgi:hypothetical protein
VYDEKFRKLAISNELGLLHAKQNDETSGTGWQTGQM